MTTATYDALAVRALLRGDKAMLKRRAHDAGHVSSVTGRATFTARLDDSQAADMDAYA